MKTLTTAFLALSLIGATTSAQAFDMNSLTPSMTFPKPKPADDTVTRDIQTPNT